MNESVLKLDIPFLTPKSCYKKPKLTLGCLRTTIFLPDRAASSKFIALSLEIKRSGLFDELEK